MVRKLGIWEPLLLEIMVKSSKKDLICLEFLLKMNLMKKIILILLREIIRLILILLELPMILLLIPYIEVQINLKG